MRVYDSKKEREERGGGGGTYCRFYGQLTLLCSVFCVLYFVSLYWVGGGGGGGFWGSGVLGASSVPGLKLRSCPVGMGTTLLYYLHPCRTYKYLG